MIVLVLTSLTWRVDAALIRGKVIDENARRA
ncbi:MAG: hypothetical protein M2R45_05130 [Verrucomicrobia subdivision 3 bacterium]|nr:hypothetical protein [Limisphaerales bacterium]MCS1417192.1 hypothetical protein [Limisphaerales bacterium]